MTQDEDEWQDPGKSMDDISDKRENSNIENAYLFDIQKCIFL